MPVSPPVVTPSTNLVTDARAQQNPQLAALATSNAAYYASLLAAASKAIQRSCHRNFLLTSYTEYVDGEDNSQQVLLLPEFPVASISRVATRPTPVITVGNSGATAQRATVATTATGLTLLTVASGVTTTAGLLYTGNVTLTALAASVNGLGGGWSASVVPGYELFPSADLKPLQGAITALQGPGARLEMYIEDIEPCGFTEGEGGWWGGFLAGAYGWRLDEKTGHLFVYAPRGRRNVRIDYQAGYVAVPDPIQEATVQHAVDLYNASSKDFTVQSERLGDYGQTLALSRRPMSVAVAGLIGPYVDHSKLVGQSRQ